MFRTSAPVRAGCIRVDAAGTVGPLATCPLRTPAASIGAGRTAPRQRHHRKGTSGVPRLGSKPGDAPGRPGRTTGGTTPGLARNVWGAAVRAGWKGMPLVVAPGAMDHTGGWPGGAAGATRRRTGTTGAVGRRRYASGGSNGGT